MKMKFIVVYLLLALCVFIPFRSSTDISITYVQPSLRVVSWEVGRSYGTGDPAARRVGPRVNTFITNSEETCKAGMVIAYDGNDFLYPIEDFSFHVEMSHGFAIDNSEYYEYRSGPDPIFIDPQTRFNVYACLKGPPDTESLPHSQNGRENAPMVVKIKFVGEYGTEDVCSTCSGMGCGSCQVVIEREFIQDTKDQMRQEYVDMTPPKKNGKPTKAELPIPEKSEFGPTITTVEADKWNTGHYPNLMINQDLIGKRSAWVAETNKYRRDLNVERVKAGLSELSMYSDSDFKVNSGYRNPYHQRFHAAKPQLGSFHSRHQYGDALDVKTIDVDGDGKVEQLKWKRKTMTQEYAESKSDDGVAMQEAAVKAGAGYTASYEWYSTHVHADWTARGSNWPPPVGTKYSVPCSVSAPSSDSTTTTASSDEEEPDDGGTDTVASFSGTLSSDSGSTASAGDTHTFTFSANSAYNSVWWYVKGPSDTSGYGTGIETDYGDGSTTTAYMSYTFPSDVSGDYVILAYVYAGDNSVYEERYTVTVSLPSSSTTPAASTVSLPVWSNIPDPYNLTVGDSFTLDVSSYVTGSPTITSGVGVIPAGLSFSGGVLSGTVSGVESRSIRFIATNAAGTAKSEWVDINITSTQGAAPVWSNIPDPYNLTVGESFTLNLSRYVTGSPTFTRNGGKIPTGLRFRNGVVSGTVSRVESRSFRFTATNSIGSADSEWIRINVTAAQ